jgi:WD40 repeat protein
LVFSSDNKILAAEYRNGRGILWDMVTGTPKALPIGDDEAIFELSLSPDGKSVAWIGSTKASAGSRRQNIGASDRTKERHLVLWRFTTNDPPQTLVPKGAESLAGLAFSYDGKTLATSDRSGSLILWNPNDGSRIAVLQNPQSQPQRLQNAVTGVALAFSLDSKTVTVASPGSSVMFWDVESRKPLDEPLTEHRRRVTKMTFSSTTQGQMMASIAFRDKIVLWDINTRQALGGISPPFVTVDESLSRDGKFLIVAGKDTLVSWDVGVDAWLRVACQIANRDLTWSEWVKYIGGEVTTRKTCTN